MRQARARGRWAGLAGFCALLLLLFSARCTREPQLSLQTQIDAADVGATITIEPGEYIESLHIEKPIVLEGAGDSPEDVRIIGSVGGVAAIDIEGDVHVEIRNLTIERGTGGVELKDEAQIALSHVAIVDAHASGITLYDSASAVLDRCTIANSFRNGVSLTDASSLHAVQCRFSANGAAGIAASTRGTVVICDSQIAVSGECGAELRGNTRSEFRQVEFGTNGWSETSTTILDPFSRSGLWLSGNSQTLVDGCVIVDSCGIGILIEDSAALEAQKTEILQSGDAGVAADDAADAELRDCAVIDGRGWGVGAWGASHVVLRTVDVSHNALTGIVAVGSSHTELYGSVVSGNGEGGVAAYTLECYQEREGLAPFYGLLVGSGNTIPGPSEGFGNARFATCPERLRELLCKSVDGGDSAAE